MTKYALLSLSLTATLGAFAQNWHTDSTALHFPPTNEQNSSSRQVWIKNKGSEFIEVADIDLFKRYQQEPFSVSDTSLSIAPQDSVALQVSFHPQHNILYRQVLVLKSNNGFGHRVISLRGQGTFSKSYYRNTRNKAEEQLKTALKTITANNYNSLGYTTARDRMYGSIDNNNGSVEGVYTGRTANFSTRAGANNNSFNTEHTFPQGFFNKNEPMRSDIHHLFPTDVSANSRRSNHPFGVVSNATWSQGGSKSNGSTFEPRDVHKGDAARAMMYFVIRYRDYSNHFKGQENILRQWHRSDSVSGKEIQRNQDIFTQQKNRNPFVDYPQLERRINSFVSNSTAPARYASYFSDDTLKVLRGQGGYTFHFVIYNSGNQPINYANFALNSAAGGLIFGQGNPGTFTLSPGMHREIVINYDGSQSYSNARLTFTERQGNTAVNHQIPVVSEGAIGLPGELVTPPAYTLSPNPVVNKLEISGEQAPDRIELYDTSGRLLLSVKPELRRTAPFSKTLDVRTLKRGSYRIVLRTSKKGDAVFTFVKR